MSVVLIPVVASESVGNKGRMVRLNSSCKGHDPYCRVPVLTHTNTCVCLSNECPHPKPDPFFFFLLETQSHMLGSKKKKDDTVHC